MKVYLQAQGTDIWKMIVNRYDIPVGPSATTSTEKKKFEDNSKAMNAILSGSTKTVFVKVMHCEIAKEIWDKLRNIYEGDDKIKGAKQVIVQKILRSLPMRFDSKISAIEERSYLNTMTMDELH